MVWAAFYGKGKTDICFTTKKMNSLAYLQILQDNLLPFLEAHSDDITHYQQDNAPVHTSNVSQAWFRDNNIELLPWPALSPDMNPIENLWGLLARKVYRNGRRQFAHLDDLKKAILDSWATIGNDVLVKLADSMPKRCMDVIQSKGSKINY